jgi:hypothetical protein
MALKIDHEVVKGVTVAGAYARVEEIVVHRPSVRDPEVDNYFSVNVGIYRDAAAYLAGDAPIAQTCERVDYDPTGQVSFAAIYERIASKFTNAESV